MAEEVKKAAYTGKVPEQPLYNANTGQILDVSEPLSLRLPECYVMISEDSVSPKDGKERTGSIGFKVQDKWLWLSYMSMKKLIDELIENKDIFNAQLKKEREKIAVEDLK